MLLVFSSSKKAFSELHPDDFHLQGEQTSAGIEQKWPLYCPQGSGTLRQQLLMMQGIAWYCMVLHCIA